MSNKSVLGGPDYHFKGPKTTFPLSRDFTFTAAPGMLLPVYRKLITIGEKVSIKPSFFLRTDPLLAPSMTDIDVYVENYFVPMKHLMSMFDEWFTQVDDPSSDMFSPETWLNDMPVIRSATSNNAFSWMTNTYFNTVINDTILDYYDVHGHTFGFDLHRLTNMLGYNAQSLFVKANKTLNTTAFDGIVDNYGIRQTLRNTDCPAFCPYYYAAYQKIYMDVYRNSEFEHNNVKSYNMDSVVNAGTGWFDPSSDWSSRPGTYWGSSNTRLGMFELRYRNRNKDYFTAIHPNPLFNSLGFVSDVKSNMNSIHNWLSSTSPVFSSDGLSLQNDSFFSVSASLGGTTGSDYERWRTNNSSGTNVGSGNVSFNSTATSLQNDSNASGVKSVIHDHLITGTAVGSGTFNDLNLAALRSNFAFEKLLRVMNSAGRHADDQLFALFGVKLPKGIANEVYRLKSYHTMVHIGEVVSTAQTNTSDGESFSVTPLGEMAGRGSSTLSDSKGFTFTAPCHGIIMSIFSIAPRFKYVNAVEKDGFKIGINDFFRPQTDNLGQQPLFGYELGYNISTVTSTTRQGWQYAHMEDKSTFDKSSIAFVTNGKNPWSFCKAAPVYIPGTNYGNDYKFEKISPNSLDTIFVAEYDGIKTYPNVGNETTAGNWYTQFPTSYLRDPFTIDMHFDVLYTSSMSRFSEPSLGGI